MSAPERPLLPSTALSPDAATDIARFHRSTVDEVAQAIAEHAIVVVGMRQNPVVKQARKALDEAGLSYHYLEYGSYMSAWKQRLAIKLWSGWPTFPQVFASGRLLGGFEQTKAAIEQGASAGGGEDTIQGAVAPGR